MVSLAKLPVRMTVAEFLNWDPDDCRRYQLVDGEPRCMAPTSPAHGILVAELSRRIGNHLRDSGRGCRVVVAPGVLPQVLSAHNFRIPDVAVSCAPIPATGQILPEPLLIVEMLSPSNKRETWSNVWAYTSIASVREILVLRADRVEAELLRRGADGRWPERAEMVTARLELRSIAFGVDLAELFEGTGVEAA